MFWIYFKLTPAIVNANVKNKTIFCFMSVILKLLRTLPQTKHSFKSIYFKKLNEQKVRILEFRLSDVIQFSWQKMSYITCLWGFFPVPGIV